ncbi:MAG TPA: phosphatidylserine/phosphatidylglycerophosphate/cardiolipin synthase family protein, partial [Ktedonobacterales bacterium]|nr:phosphatidylserine/phosphatidylglycerophosphate/cardiolipin synthase family protein [Ktedonobacterales bacterium]
AKQYILLAGWDIRADLLMVRGEDAHVGEEGSREQLELLADLRAEGLDDDALALWDQNRLRVADVLGFAAGRGVRVGVLLWDAFHMGSHLTNDPVREQKLLRAAGVDCLLDDSSRHIKHITQSLHQKCAVVDGRVAFLGGLDLTAEVTGDYDRWDTHTHPCDSPIRASRRTAPAHPWHDVHTRIEGPIVADVQLNIVQRWVEVATRHRIPDWPIFLPFTPPAPLADGTPAQIVRTIPPRTYGFAPDGIGTIREAYLRALAQARSYIYIENQYLWPEVFLGLDRLAWGERSPEVEQLLQALGAALQRGVHVTVVLPDHPNTGRRFTDGGIARLAALAQQAVASGLLNVFTLGNSEADASLPGGTFYRPVYVHAKVAIIDDLWWTAGSANLNSRGLQSDAEINVVALDPARARELRLGLWREHLHESYRDLADPLGGLAQMRECAARNLEHVRAGQLLEGHLLPYIPAHEAQRFGARIDPEHGWLDTLPSGVGAMPPEHAGRYI